jgi:hypothetical protein
MKKIAIALFLLTSLATQGQNIESGSMWYNGALIYDATLLEGEKVLMSTTAEGEEIGFMLVPVQGKPDTYSITQSPHDAMMVEEEDATVQYLHQDAIEVLCFYNPDGNLYKLMTKTDEQDNQKLNVENWMRMIRGDYTMADGTKVSIDWDKALIGGTYVPVEAMTFNGHTTGILKIDGEGTQLNGYMEVEFTTEGLQLYEVGFDEYGFPHRLLRDSITLTESNPMNSRFDFVGYTLLHGSELYYYNKPALRLMRNSILARHGYVFQSKDLKKYFGNEPWYHPADSNDDIHLSFLEQLNIELIKYREATIDIEQ